MSRQFTVTADGNTYPAQIATVKSTHLGPEDHGIFTAILRVQWGAYETAIGGSMLDRGDSGHRIGTAYGLDQIMWIMRTVGARRWEDLPGKRLLLLFEDSSPTARVVGIAHLTNEDEVFVFQEHFEAWKDKS